MISATLAALAFSLPQQADMSQKVTFEAKAAGIETVLEGLSKQIGGKLMVSPVLKGEYLILSIKDAPLNQVLDRIAEATHAEWQSESGGYRLIRGAKLDRELRQRHIELETQRFAKAIDKIRDRVSKEGAFDEAAAKLLSGQIEAMISGARERRGDPANWRAQQLVTNGLPGSRLAARVACLLDPKFLGAMEDPGKIVFSTRPNRMQRPLPEGVGPLIEAYVREQALMRTQVERFAQPDPSNLDWAVFNLIRNQKIKDATPAKVLVEVRTWEFASNAMVTVKVANASGRIIENGSCSLDVQENGMSGPPPGPQKDPTGDPPLEFSATSKEFSRAIQAAMASSQREFTLDLPESVRPIFYEPEKHTMSEMVCSDLLLGLARAKNVNVAASPSDLFGFYCAVLFSAGPPSSNQFLERLRSPFFVTELRESPGWVVLRSSDPIEEERYQMDRFRLGSIVRNAVANKKLGIDEMASFATSTPENFERGALFIYLMIAAPSVGRDFERSGWPLLRFHGLLELPQRRALETGQKLAFSRLSPAQQRIFQRMVFENHDGMSETRSERPQPLSADADEQDDFGHESLRWEPTERYPNGLGPLAGVWLRQDAGPRIRASGLYQGQYRTSGDLSVDELANHLFSGENPDSAWARDTQYSEFTFIRQRKLEYAFEADSEYSFEGSLQEILESSRPVSSVDKLPPDVYRQITEAIARFREAAKNRRPPLRE